MTPRYYLDGINLGTKGLGSFIEIQGDQVYSVKWYKGGLEIFRFIPSNNPAIAVFER